MLPYSVQYPTVAQSGQLSTTFQLAGARAVGLWAPVITSAQVFVHVSFDQSSANFVRAYNLAGSGSYMFEPAAGSAAVVLTPTVIAFPFGRLFLSAAQTDVRTFAILTKAR